MEIISTPFVSGTIFDPIVRALEKCFYIRSVNPKKQNWTDVFDKYKPSLVFTEIGYVDSKLIELRKEYPDCKIVLFGNGEPENLNADIICVSQSINPIIHKNIQAGKGDGQVIKIKQSADITFDNIEPYAFNLDVVCLVENKNDLNTIIPILVMLQDMNYNFNIITRTDSGIELPIVEHIGAINYKQDFIRVVRSSLLYIDTNSNGQNLLNLAAYGGFAITLYPNKLFPALNDCWVVEKFLKQPKLRNEISKDAQRNILEHNTCYHELLRIAKKIGDEVFINKIETKLKDRVSWILES